MPPSARLRVAVPTDLAFAEAYAVLRLREAVFVVEQDCPYPELDGRDLEPDCRWLWYTDDDGAVLASLRVLTEDDGVRRIGRVVTAPAARGRGLAAELMRECLQLIGDRAEAVLNAQVQLVGWYERFGFRGDGAEFLEDGIPHRPMRRPVSG
ncbi:GNAT family N-acetyltransferase [Enemella evansiae]|uniref:GNAT family N-acetyltransferase n=1 Tax=Enemella evansiae TaxID=2016499 RepID=A0A255G3R4_9ACTN|nr:GNAT family N-acetyltransferase [Enemella evansiae]OYO10559.1 GNAT family N-acetyltransferase [Enemella evansiae]